MAPPLSPKTFELPLDLDDEAFSIRRAEWTDLPFSTFPDSAACCLTDVVLVTAVYNHALLHSEVCPIVSPVRLLNVFQADDLHGTISMTEKGETLSELLALGLPVSYQNG